MWPSGQICDPVDLLNESSIVCWYDSGASFRWRGKNKQKETPLQRKGSEESVGSADSEQLFNNFWSVFSMRCVFFFLQTRLGKFVWC